MKIRNQILQKKRKLQVVLFVTSKDKITFSNGEVHDVHTSSSMAPKIKIGWTF